MSGRRRPSHVNEWFRGLCPGSKGRIPAGRGGSVVSKRIDREEFEREARALGHSRIAGVDEVARAAWAGPMVAAAVILPVAFDATGIRSSKKMTPERRIWAYERILLGAISVSVTQVSAADIDKMGIDTAHMELLRRAVAGLDKQPDYVLVDYYEIPRLAIPQQAITRGDNLSVSIGAASIVAKVTCDRLMDRYGRMYLGYGFALNKGYGSEAHLRALAELGPSPIHRLTVGPVRRSLERRPV